MKHVMLLLGVLFAGTPSAYAQSEEWEVSPELRGAIVTNESFWWDPSDTRMVGHHDDGTHWYEEGCCSNQDCRGFSPALVTENRDGTATLILPPYGFFQGVSILFTNDEIRDRPSNARSDYLWHFCFELYTEMSTESIMVLKRCAYRPSPGV